MKRGSASLIATLIVLAAAPCLIFGKPRTGVVTVAGLRRPVRIAVLPGHDGLARNPRPAKLCAYAVPGGARVDCFEPRAKGWAFFGNPRARTVRLTGSEKAVLFSASSNGGGSGSATLWALLIFGRDRKWKNLLPVVTTSEQSDHLYWFSSDISPYGLFTIADYVWEKGEFHFSEHRYRIETFEFCPLGGTYALADQFVTRRKFPGLDEVDTIRVIEPNFKEIDERLLRRRPLPCP